MPFIAVLHLLIAIGFAVHAMRTGRPQYWVLILIFVPLVGSIAYVLFELLPELANTRRARGVASDVGTLIDPDREWRKRRDEANRTDSVEAKRALAEECERKGMWREAAGLYEAAAHGIFADEPWVLAGLARSQLGASDAHAAEATLDRLRAAHPNLEHAEGHLVYARVQEALGRMAEAEEEYESVSRYYLGLEARTRYGLLLLRRGSANKARSLFDEVVRASNARGVIMTPADREWAKVAKANL